MKHRLPRVLLWVGLTAALAGLIAVRTAHPTYAAVGRLFALAGLITFMFGIRARARARMAVDPRTVDTLGRIVDSQQKSS